MIRVVELEHNGKSYSVTFYNGAVWYVRIHNLAPIPRWFSRTIYHQANNRPAGKLVTSIIDQARSLKIAREA